MTDRIPASGRPPGATPGQLLAVIRAGDGWTRQQLLDATGMSRPTLLARLAPLLAAGLVYESGATASTGGRPAQVIRFDDRQLVVLTFDIGHTHGTVSVADIHGQPLRSARRSVDVYRTAPDETMPPLFALADQLLAAGTGERLTGIGMGLPAPIDPATGLPGHIWIMPKWRDYPLHTHLADRWPVPLALENDARALALGEATVVGGGTLLGVKWANGIGAGAVVDGRLLTGEDGAAGDIGHIRIGEPDGPRCRCGRRGCLAAYASGHALRRRLRSRSLDDLVARHAAGDPAVRAAFDDAADRVGTVLAALIAMVNPRVLVLGGIIGRMAGVVDRVDRRLRSVALSRSTEGLEVLRGRLGEHAATVGLAHLIIERVLEPDAIDATLGTR